MKPNAVLSVAEGSIADELGIKPRDVIISINGQKVNDVFDYRYLTADSEITLEIETVEGITEFEIEKDEDEDLGLEFCSGLMDGAKRCANKCVFCFIDQLPSGMRETLYFKDDDARLSFLTGNYVTLTNVTEAEFERVLFYHLSPINISVHAVNDAVRAKMLGNRRGGVLDKIRRLAEAGVEMNFQVVLCPGINDGEILDETITRLAEFIPKARSLSVVPVGLTRFRDGLFALNEVDSAYSESVLAQIECHKRKFLSEYGTSFVYAADEFYIKAGVPIPGYEDYEDFPQLENGVGMIALFRFEVLERLRYIEENGISACESPREVTVVTGEGAQFFIRECAEIIKLSKLGKNVTINVVAVKNEFFGGNVDVSGLLTGRDVVAALSGKAFGGDVLVPANALRAGDDVFLDDMTVGEISEKLGRSVVAVDIDGGEFVDKILGIGSIK